MLTYQGVPGTPGKPGEPGRVGPAGKDVSPLFEYAVVYSSSGNQLWIFSSSRFLAYKLACNHFAMSQSGV